MHQHFAVDGTPTGYTLVKREPEWDDASRDAMLALGEYEAGICECGFHESLTSDMENHFDFPERFCNVCIGRAQTTRIKAEVDAKIVESFGEKPPAEKVRPSDGRRVFTRMLSDAQVAERERLRGLGAHERGPDLQ